MLHVNKFNMIDWVTLSIFLPHEPLPAGRIMRVSSEGNIEWETPSKVHVKGSFDECFELRSQGVLNSDGKTTELYLSGNPSKFLQLHNVFGSSDLRSLVMFSLLKIGTLVSLPKPTWEQVDNATLHRIDITESFAFQSREEARAYVRGLAVSANSRLGRASIKGWTCYFGKHSRRWAIKAYTKGDELQKHKISDDLAFKDQIENFADKLARVELTLRSKELKQLEKRQVKDWPIETVEMTYCDYVERLKMSNQVTLTSDVITNMPRCIRDTYFMWEKGIEVFNHMKQPTFYRHRSLLLGYGVDIALPRDVEHTAEIIPLKKMIQGQIVGIPGFAMGQSIYFEPKLLKVI